MARKSSRLVSLELADDLPGPSGTLTIYAAHPVDRALGRAGRWLLDDLTNRLSA